MDFSIENNIADVAIRKTLPFGKAIYGADLQGSISDPEKKVWYDMIWYGIYSRNKKPCSGVN